MNKDGVLEIVIREADKKFKVFKKVVIQELQNKAGEEQQLLKKVVEGFEKQKKQLNHLDKIINKNFAQLGNLGKFGVLLNGLTLCATITGFMIISEKLEKMSADINRQLQQIQKSINQSQDLQGEYEFNKVLSEHTNMLDSQRRMQPYSEEKMRELVDREYNVLKLLIGALRKDVSSAPGELIFCIFSLLSMLTVSLMSFDELYYFNNQNALKNDKNVWHLSHEKWMSVFETLVSDWFIEKMQDCAIFEEGYRTSEVDVYYLSLLQQVKDLREKIEDNQELMLAFNDKSLFYSARDVLNKEVVRSIENFFKEAGNGMDESFVKQTYQSAMQAAGLAI